jgi:hypothetical protein
VPKSRPLPEAVGSLDPHSNWTPVATVDCSCPRREDWAITPRREDWVIVIERAAGFGDSPFR